MTSRQQCQVFDVLSFEQPNAHQSSIAKRQPRSTTGCSNCKKRKLKCDEKKPSCSRCRDRRLKCPGYPANTLKWSSKHEIHKALPSEKVSSPTQYTPQEAVAGHQDNPPPQDRDTQQGYSDSFSASPTFSFVGPLPDSHTSQLISTISNSNPSNAGSTIEQSRPSIHAPSPLEALFDVEDPFASPLVADVQTFDRLTSDLESVDASTWPESCIAYGNDDQISTPDHSDAQENIHLPASSTDMRRGLALSPTVLHVPTVLVEYYFRNVCRECSTFDSSYNPFRSTIANMQSSSAPIHYVIQSLAAAKLADDMPRMKIAGFEAQGEALMHLKRGIMAVDGLHNVSEEMICTLLLLGMTTSWHVREDLGVEYFMLARSVIIAKCRLSGSTAKLNLNFYCNALKYWSMIVSLVSDQNDGLDDCEDELTITTGQLQPSSSHFQAKIMPHPWSGVSPAPVHLFGQVLQLIRTMRGKSNPVQGHKFSMAGIANFLGAIATARRLEAKCWTLHIPSVNEIDDTNDTSTPSIHHVLTARAYLLSTLLHIYMVFPDVLQARIELHVAQRLTGPILENFSYDASMAHLVMPELVWPQRAAEDSHKLWLRDIGLQIVECLRAIDVKSGTRVVHPPLLLSVASALCLAQPEDGMTAQREFEIIPLPQESQLPINIDSIRSQVMERENFRIRQSRIFIINRLENMHALMRFHAIENILTVVKEVWRRADTGAIDIFWMDIMHELRCESIFG